MFIQLWYKGTGSIPLELVNLAILQSDFLCVCVCSFTQRASQEERDLVLYRLVVFAHCDRSTEPSQLGFYIELCMSRAESWMLCVIIVVKNSLVWRCRCVRAHKHPLLVEVASRICFPSPQFLILTIHINSVMQHWPFDQWHRVMSVLRADPLRSCRGCCEATFIYLVIYVLASKQPYHVAQGKRMVHVT